MNRRKKITAIREALRSGGSTVGSWIQIPHPSIAEILGCSGYDWVAADMEHGAICAHQLPDLFRALELGGTLPMVRLAHGDPTDCKQALDAGAGGVIVPMVESAQQLERVRDSCRWPPAGKRGVGFSRANLFGANFELYAEEAQAPLLVAMIEHTAAVKNLPEILSVEGLDALLVGPYDLSASMGMTGAFDRPEFVAVMDQILITCNSRAVPCGLHVIMPDAGMLQKRIDQGYRFIAYSIDAVFLNISAKAPETRTR